MMESSGSVAPVILHPAAPAVQSQTPARAGGIKAWTRGALLALAAAWRWLPSVEDARKFVVNTLMIAGAGLALVVIVNAALTPATIIDAIGVPKELEERGYTSAVVAQRLIDEMAQIAATASSLSDHATFSSQPFESKVPKIDLPVPGMSVAMLVSQLRELMGITDTRISGEMIAERPPEAGDKAGSKALSSLSLRLRIMDTGAIYVGEPEAKPDLLLRPAALRLVERFDPYIAAAYYYVNEDFDNAQRMLQRVLDSNRPDKHKLAVNLRGAIALSQNRLDEALAIFTSLIEQDSHAANPRLNRASVRMVMGQQAEQAAAARAQFEQALGDARQAMALAGAFAPAKTPKQKRDIAMAHTAAAEALFYLFDGSSLDEAIVYLRQAEEVFPKYGRAYFLHGRIHRARGQRPEAVVMFARAADVDPNYPDIQDVYTSWGEVLREMGRAREAQKIFEKAIAAKPRNPNAYSQIGQLYLDQRDWGKAADHFRQAIELNPSWAWFHYYSARALAGGGEPDAAIAALRKATQLDPQQAPSYALWGRLLAESARGKTGKAAVGLKQDAAVKLAAAATMAPGDRGVLKDVGKGYSMLGMAERALDAYFAALAAGGDTDEELLAEIAKLRGARH